MTTVPIPPEPGMVPDLELGVPGEYAHTEPQDLPEFEPEINDDEEVEVE